MWIGPWRCPQLEAEIRRCRAKGKPVQYGYHGTNAAAAERILEEGFRPGTYFAIQMGDALYPGNDHVFAVPFGLDFTPRGGWQWVEPERVDPCRIAEVHRAERIYWNEKPFKAMGDYNMEREGL